MCSRATADEKKKSQIDDDDFKLDFKHHSH